MSRCVLGVHLTVVFWVCIKPWCFGCIFDAAVVGVCLMVVF